MTISVVIPCYRSEKTIGKVVAEIKAVFAKQSKYGLQIVLVNDGSPDGTFGVIKELCAGDKSIVGADLSRNFGQASAKLAGLRYVKGDITVFMDDDGQHPAEGIFRLADKICEGYDIVYAHFPKKKHSLFKRMTSGMQRRLGVWAGNTPKGIYVSSFIAYSAFVVEKLKGYNSPFISVGGYLMRITTRIANVDMEHRGRLEGRSGYTFKKLLNLWLDTITNFSIVPLRLASFLGFVSSFLGLVFCVAIVIRKLVSPNIAVGYTSTIAVTLFIGGVIMLMLGFLGEYIGRIYMTVSGAPQYSVRECLNSGGASGGTGGGASDGAGGSGD